jgi:hypothetical protein
MNRRFIFVFLTLVVAILTVLIAAKHPTGPNTVSYEEPVGLILSNVFVILLFLPPLILSLIGKRLLRIIAGIYQAFVGIIFLGIIPIGFLFEGALDISIVACIGFLVSITSVIMMFKTSSNSTNEMSIMSK